MVHILCQKESDKNLKNEKNVLYWIEWKTRNLSSLLSFINRDLRVVLFISYYT